VAAQGCAGGWAGISDIILTPVSQMSASHASLPGGMMRLFFAINPSYLIDFERFSGRCLRN
jgi:hypothetical protein